MLPIFFLYDFRPKLIKILPDQNVPIPLIQNVSIRLVRNMYNGNIGTFWLQKLGIKTWYSSKSL